MKNSQWFKCNIQSKNGLCYDSENALVLAESELHALNFIRSIYTNTLVQSTAVPYCTTPVMTVDFQTLKKGKESNIDLIMVAI